MPAPPRLPRPRPGGPDAAGPPVPAPDGPPLPGYAELHCRSHFSFLTGASHPEELVQRAHDLGYAALALTDECSVAGVVRAHEAARQVGLPLVVGSLLRLHGAGDAPGCVIIVLALDREGYGDLCELITLGRSRRPKGQYRLDLHDLDDPPPERAHLRGLPRCHVLWLPQPVPLPPDAEDTRIHPVGEPPRAALPPPDWPAQARWVKATFGDRADAAVQRLRRAGEAAWVTHLETVAAQAGLPLVATGDVLMHRRSRKPLQDTLTALRLQRPLAECGRALAPNAEQHLRPRATLAGLMRPAWLARSVEIARACRFRLDELRYEYPEEIVPPGHTPGSWLRHETEAGLRRRYPGGAPAAVRAQIERELALVAELRYEAFFLTVHDLVGFARSRGILCQGRGSAANSAVCFCLGITEVDPTHTTLLFERFISRERDEPPDIDVDFEHERREEVIQYIYRRYGRDRTALAAALITYRTRGAVRDAGRALGLEEPVIAALARSCQWFDPPDELARRLGGLGLDPQAPLVRRWLDLTNQLQGVPRHLSQHVGGFVIARGKLSRLVPIENTAMADRQVIQWDKDDLESLGLLKVDVLALGMLSALRRALDLRAAWRGTPWTLGDIPREDPATYAMIQRADTVGTFQIESRAQQSMLPRLKPRTLYDLVIEVAIVRPGPIQGGMVHPYLRRKQGLEPVTLPDPALEVALGRTLGVPIFQEQVMQVCMIAAGFSGGEADALRRAMAAWRRKGGVHQFHARVVEGMVERGYEREFAESIFRQILGFGDYGFPESHAYGFAILAYFSAWLKCHEPVIFTAALLNSQPMGFYAPSQLVQDLRRHGGEVRPPDVSHSDWDCTLEPADAAGAPGASRGGASPGGHAAADTGEARGDAPQPALRLGLRLISGLARADAERLVAARRAGGPWRDLPDLARRTGLGPAELERLARADALRSLSGHRRQQAWQAAGEQPLPALLRGHAAAEPALALPEAPEAEEVVLDHVTTGLTLRRHPLALLRPRLRPLGWRTAAELEALEDGDPVWAAGIVVTRQQPETAGGTVFVTLEDETGPVNVIVWRAVRDRDREALLGARLLAVRGLWQRRDGVRHLVARRLVDASAWLGRLDPRSRDFR